MKTILIITSIIVAIFLSFKLGMKYKSSNTYTTSSCPNREKEFKERLELGNCLKRVDLITDTPITRDLVDSLPCEESE